MEKLFGTDGIRGKANAYPITPEMALRLGKAAAVVFARKNQEKRGFSGARNASISERKGKVRILLGKDTRISGYILENALTSGICAMGADALLVGPMPTPAISYLTVQQKADAGIVISASHNPAEDNGIKFFSADGKKISEKIEHEIEQLALADSLNSTITAKNLGKAYRIDDARKRYISLVKNSYPTKLTGLKIVLDCANGAAYAVAPAILRELGVKVIAINNKPDGLNINQNCGALYPKAMIAAVKKYKAAAGIALDGDGDRVIMADETARILDGDDILAICAISMRAQKQLHKNTIVATVMTNIGIEQALKQQGISMLRTPVGDKYVAQKLEEEKLAIGGEQAGHIIFLHKQPKGDGMIAALAVLGIMKKTRKKLSQLAAFPKYQQTLINIKVKEKKDFNAIPKVYNSIRQAQQQLGNQGRVLVRYSGTENLARVMIEGKEKGTVEQLAQNIAAQIQAALGA